MILNYAVVNHLQEEEDEDEEPGAPEEYGGAASIRTRATRRVGTTRSGGRSTTRSRIGRLRQTQRKTRSTTRSTGSQRLTEEGGGIALAEMNA